MAHDNASRRFLAALTDATPAFAPRPMPNSMARSRGRRFLAALADATPAFANGASSHLYALDPLTGVTDGAPSVEADQASAETATAVREALIAFATVLASQSAEQRLAIRAVAPEDELAVLRTMTLAHHRVQRARNAFFSTDLEIDTDVARTIERDIDFAHALERDIDRARLRAYRFRMLERDLESDIAREIDTEITLARNLARDLARILARDLGRNLFRDLDRDLDHAFNRLPALLRTRHHDFRVAASRAADLAEGRARPREHIRFLVQVTTQALAHALATAYNQGVDLLRLTGRAAGLRLPAGSGGGVPVHSLVAAIDAIDHVLTDFTDANLRTVDLEHIRLVGVRWSSRTQWPEDWRDYIRSNSVLVAPDVYEIRSGETSLDDHVLV